MNRTARIAIAVAAAITGLGLATTTAQAAIPNPGPTGTHTETRIDPATGRPAPARITEYPSITIRPGGQQSASTSIAPAPGTDGLFLRAANGGIKGLMAEGDQARFLACHPTNPNLALVRQVTHGHGGWGAYVGYVKISATTEPGRIPCAG
ncbi:hypothetical protein ABR737_00965 [Streptomyces sp. Edi2]|uniref:hypothetical protein n=1 Tax=Streptomyces sp. Edi2 TaxID=3162528 RepID=UPI003306141E